MPRCVLVLLCLLGMIVPASAADKVNILFAIADDWGQHAGAYRTPVIQTPTFDRLAKEGVVFDYAYVSSPSCTPSRGAILTGKYHWQLEQGANLWSTFPDKFATYPEMFREAGYHVGVMRKGWGPGTPETPERELVGKRYKSFEQFMEARPEGTPFCFWLGSSDPHRPYKAGTGKASGMDLEEIRVPACFPDAPVVRSDIADYFFEVQRFDALVGDAVKLLEERGELDNTIVVMTGDHGMPFPRSKSNLYDSGTQVPLAIRAPMIVDPGRHVQKFVSLVDLAPTFLEVARLDVPAEMTGESLLPLLTTDAAGCFRLPGREQVVFGKERHVPSQEAPEMGGYPSRGIRNYSYLYIVNYEPDRWPNGTPDSDKAAFNGMWYGDTDNSPTKSYMIDNRDKDEVHALLYDLSFAKRPAEELYSLSPDPFQLINVADDPGFLEVKEELRKQLEAKLRETNDPRVVGGAEKFDGYPYLGRGGPKKE